MAIATLFDASLLTLEPLFLKRLFFCVVHKCYVLCPVLDLVVNYGLTPLGHGIGNLWVSVCVVEGHE